jgi:hypothetical protein
MKNSNALVLEKITEAIWLELEKKDYQIEMLSQLLYEAREEIKELKGK